MEKSLIKESLKYIELHIEEPLSVAEISKAMGYEVVMLKLAERLHNMRTAQFVTERLRKEKAKETIKQIFPVAQRMGNKRLSRELYDLSMKYL